MHDSWPVSDSTRFLVVGIALYLHSPFTVGLTVCLTGQEGQELRSGARGALSYSAITARPVVFTMSCKTFLKAREVALGTYSRGTRHR